MLVRQAVKVGGIHGLALTKLDVLDGMARLKICTAYRHFGQTLHHLPAAIGAFGVAVSNNFLWNRVWTFDARAGHAGFQAARFLCVSLVGLAFNLVILELLVSAAGVVEVPAQAIAVALSMPVNFVGNKLWTFGRP